MRRPPCPMCGGKAVIEGETHQVIPGDPGAAWWKDADRICPECMEDPGWASMDRIMAIASGVINDVDDYGDNDWQSIRHYLMTAELAKR